MLARDARDPIAAVAYARPRVECARARALPVGAPRNRARPLSRARVGSRLWGRVAADVAARRDALIPRARRAGRSYRPHEPAPRLHACDESGRTRESHRTSRLDRRPADEG